jgi:arylformamidase
MISQRDFFAESRASPLPGEKSMWTGRIIDISRPIGSATAIWPGDTPFELAFPVSRTSGETVTVGSIRMSTHFGTHLDAPIHFTDSEVTIDRVPLRIVCGPAVVIDSPSKDEIVLPEDIDLPARVLFRTGGWPNHRKFPDHIPTLAAGTIERLAKVGVQLIGVDLPSVDALGSNDLPIHHQLFDAGIHILESLWLEPAWPGNYWLVALPLKLVGGDASPVRAVLLSAVESESS